MLYVEAQHHLLWQVEFQSCKSSTHSWSCVLGVQRDFPDKRPRNSLFVSSHLCSVTVYFLQLPNEIYSAVLSGTVILEKMRIRARQNRNICCIEMTSSNNDSLCKRNSGCNSPATKDFTVRLMLHLILVYKMLFWGMSQSEHKHEHAGIAQYFSRKERQEGHHDSAQLT